MNAPLKPLSCLILSGHDFRSPRKANMHFIAEELVKQGPMRFFSLGFSWLSKIKKDPRLSLWSRANKVEIVGGVETYLWRSLLHPFNLHLSLLDTLESGWFKAYAQSAPKVLRDWIAASDIVIIESGMSIIFYDLIRQLNPTARVIYLCSDTLETINCAPFIRQELARVDLLLDGICLPSKRLKSEFPGSKMFYVPHGMDAAVYTSTKPSPYKSGVNLVSVGSMLFDPTFFEIAAKAFPEYTFYVIGGGAEAATLKLPNVIVYGEMAFEDTIPYLKYADAGIAAYKKGYVAPYLTDTSMKLMQFACLGVPAICPDTVAGDKVGRFGYTPGNADSITECIKDALQKGRFDGEKALSWQNVTARLLNPDAYPDTHINA